MPKLVLVLRLIQQSVNIGRFKTTDIRHTLLRTRIDQFLYAISPNRDIQTENTFILLHHSDNRNRDSSKHYCQDLAFDYSRTVSNRIFGILTSNK